MNRSLPKLSTLREQLQFKPLDIDRRRARLQGAQDVWDLRRIAQRRTPRPAFDYVDGGANSEITMRRNRDAFAALQFQPGVLRDVSSIDLSCKIAGMVSALPVGIAPTGLTRLMHSDGEIGGVQAAAKYGIPFGLSTLGTTSIENVTKAAPDALRWFQLYMSKDRERSLELLQRAEADGYSALLVTVDTPVSGLRLRDPRNGMGMPPQLTLKTILDASHRPEWWFNFLTTEPLGFANFDNGKGALAGHFDTLFDASLDFADLAWLRDNWSGKLLVKGVQTAADAVKSFGCGADGIVVSNHGGRQLDRAPVPLLGLAEIRDAVGPEAEIILDSGIMSGGDVVAAIAAGANFTLIGRAYLYGLMAGGAQGVDRVLQILKKEMEVAMALVGARDLSELTPDHIRINPNGRH